MPTSTTVHTIIAANLVDNLSALVQVLAMGISIAALMKIDSDFDIYHYDVGNPCSALVGNSSFAK